MEICSLYELAKQQNIRVLDFPMPTNGSMSVMDESGRCYVGMDRRIKDGGVQERVHLAHELGHCITGSFYNRYAAADSRRKHENQADKWAVEELIPVEMLDDAVAQGCCEVWELAEWFGVTEEFVRKAICWHVHGNMAAELYF